MSLSITSRDGTAPPQAAGPIRAALLAWYDREARRLPWRTPPGEGLRGLRPDPYRVWLSEVMLQQTTTAHAAPYFQSFLERWPTVEALAAAADAEVMAAWAGLGYYARARNLLACARTVAGPLQGRFPGSVDALQALPGIGPYTAAAIAAIAFDAAANVVDGNIERVVSRLFAIADPLPGGKARIHAAAASLVRGERPGDWAQALMDLGADICAPRAPACDTCPISFACAARALGAPSTFPARAPRPVRPLRVGHVLVVLNGSGALRVGLERRAPSGLLGGMWGLPTSAWSPSASAEPDPALFPRDAPFVGQVRHRFTHFDLKLAVLRRRTADPDPALVWTPAAEALQGLPSVFRKALALALDFPG